MARLKVLSGGALLAAGNVYSALSTFAVLSVVFNSVDLKTFGAISLLLTSVSIGQVVFNTQSWQGLLNSASLPGSSILRRCIAVDLATAASGSALLWLAYAVFPSVMLSGQPAPAILHLIVLNVALTPTGAFIAIIRRDGKFARQGLVDIASSTIKIAMAILWVRGSMTLFPVAVTLVLPELLRWCGYLLIALPQLTLRGGGVADEREISLRSIYAFSIWGMLTEIVHLPTAHIDKLLVTAVLGLETLAIWDILKRCATAVVQLTTVINQMLFPYFVRVRSTCSVEELTRQCMKHCGFLAAMLFALYGGAALTLPIWFPLAFHVNHGAWPISDIQRIFAVLGLVMTFVLGATPVHPLYLSLRHSSGNFRISLIGCFAFFCLSYLLLPPLHLYGASLAIFGSDAFIILTKIYLLHSTSEDTRAGSPAA